MCAFFFLLRLAQFLDETENPKVLPWDFTVMKKTVQIHIFTCVCGVYVCVCVCVCNCAYSYLCDVYMCVCACIYIVCIYVDMHDLHMYCVCVCVYT